MGDDRKEEVKDEGHTCHECDRAYDHADEQPGRQDRFHDTKGTHR